MLLKTKEIDLYNNGLITIVLELQCETQAEWHDVIFWLGDMVGEVYEPNEWFMRRVKQFSEVVAKNIKNYKDYHYIYIKEFTP